MDFDVVAGDEGMAIDGGGGGLGYRNGREECQG
jgi:hypothetical protein